MNKTWFRWGVGLVVIAAIVLLVIFVPKRDGANSDNSETDEMVAGESIALVEEPEVVKDGEFIYSFNSITWDFEPIQGEQTKVGFWFDSFSRRQSGIPATFGRPFFVGVYNGSCEAREALQSGDPMISTEAHVVGLAHCGEGQLIIITQDETDVTVWETVNDGTLNEVRTIDISTIVS